MIANGNLGVVIAIIFDEEIEIAFRGSAGISTTRVFVAIVFSALACLSTTLAI